MRALYAAFGGKRACGSNWFVRRTKGLEQMFWPSIPVDGTSLAPIRHTYGPEEILLAHSWPPVAGGTLDLKRKLRFSGGRG